MKRHIDEITTKASQRLHLLKLFKGAGSPPDDLVLFTAVLFAVEEYALSVFYSSLLSSLLSGLY